MSKENIEIMKTLFEAGPRGEFATVRKYLASDTEWITPVVMELPMMSTGSHKGVDAVLKEVIGASLALYDGFRPEAEEFIDVGDRVITIGRFRGKAKNTGKELDSAFVMVSTIKDGQIVRHQVVSDTAAGLRALGLELGKRATLPLKQQPVASAPH